MMMKSLCQSFRYAGIFLLSTAVMAVALPLAPSSWTGASVGFIPLNDLIGGRYQAYRGGLYPAGNERPSAHEIAGLAQAAAVVPRNASGMPDRDGRIVMLSIGMSNTHAEFGAFAALARRDAGINPQLLMINGAQSGSPSHVIAHPETNDGHKYWADIDMRLARAGIAPVQVQVVWIKVAERAPKGTFPTDALRLQRDLADIARIVKDRFPNVRLAYYSSRIYAGYARTDLNPEPYAYQSGFAVKWLIEDQIAGAPDLNFDPRRGSVGAPWLAWGPYLWADGTRPRSDGLVWRLEDFAQDGTHPSDAGALKVAGLLLDFFREDVTTRSWFGSPTRSE
jgi:hypothetical protein